MKNPGLNDIVRSRAGHDAGKLFVVTGAEGERLLLCDGKNRRLGNPKRKSPKHVQLVRQGETAPATDREIRATLALAAEQPAAEKEEKHHGER